MTPKEVSLLLTLASGFDRRQVDEVTVLAWHTHLSDVDYEDARAAVIAYQVGADRDKYMTVGAVVDACRVSGRLTRELIAADVRSARARQLVASDWPESDPVPADVAAKLSAARSAARSIPLELTA